MNAVYGGGGYSHTERGLSVVHGDGAATLTGQQGGGVWAWPTGQGGSEGCRREIGHVTRGDPGAGSDPQPACVRYGGGLTVMVYVLNCPTKANCADQRNKRLLFIQNFIQSFYSAHPYV